MHCYYCADQILKLEFADTQLLHLFKVVYVSFVVPRVSSEGALLVVSGFWLLYESVW